MLVPLSNRPRDYAWGSTSLIAALEGRTPSGRPEAELWFGDHPGDPADVEDGTGRSLVEWLAVQDAATVPARLPYLLKLLAAASSLSIQAHPTKAQAEAGFAREDAAGVARDAPERSYRDDNHKPELIVALSDPFVTLSGLRPVPDTVRLLDALGDAPGVRALRARLTSDADPASALRDTIGWLLSGSASAGVVDIIEALQSARSAEFAAELDVLRTIAADFPHDPGVVVALLMNLVALHPGEGLFVPAGVLHAYQAGIGVELMAASDNVLRGGLTPKHIDVAELLGVLDTSPAGAAILHPVPVPDAVGRVDEYATPISDFRLLRAQASQGEDAIVPVTGTAIALVVAGRVRVGSLEVAPGRAVLATPDESPLRIRGTGEVFIAQPGG